MLVSACVRMCVCVRANVRACVSVWKDGIRAKLSVVDVASADVSKVGRKVCNFQMPTWALHFELWHLAQHFNFLIKASTSFSLSLYFYLFLSFFLFFFPSLSLSLSLSLFLTPQFQFHCWTISFRNLFNKRKEEKRREEKWTEKQRKDSTILDPLRCFTFKYLIWMNSNRHSRSLLWFSIEFRGRGMRWGFFIKIHGIYPQRFSRASQTSTRSSVLDDSLWCLLKDSLEDVSQFWVSSEDSPMGKEKEEGAGGEGFFGAGFLRALLGLGWVGILFWLGIVWNGTSLRTAEPLATQKSITIRKLFSRPTFQ